ncbi:hypothetical protein BK636_00360 [Pseudomonas chlororaphis]|nr:hypothetical protein BK636_00360 [Pseudomonas chlororaphis]
MITQITLAAVVDAGKVAVGVVGIGAAVEVLVLAVPLLADAMGLQAALFVVLVLAEQQALLALLFAAGVELVAGQARAVEVDIAKVPSRGANNAVDRLCEALRCENTARFSSFL